MQDDDTLDRGELVQGLLYAHTRSNLNTVEVHQTRAAVDALAELLIERGLVTRADYDTRRAQSEARMRESYVEKGMAVAIQERDVSKYDVEGSGAIDCVSRVSLCKAACCRLHFALSKEDVEEGIVRWNLGHPYFVARAPDGCCTHLDPGTRCCRVYEHRPIACREYDCREDERVWLDFANRVPNPRVSEADWPGCLQQDRATPASGSPEHEPG